MDTARSAGRSKEQSVPTDADAGRSQKLEPFLLRNIIDIPALDVDVYPKYSLHSATKFDILVFDPGLMVGWAGTTTYGGTKSAHIEAGQGNWYDCMRFRADKVFVETTPYAAQRTFDPWPIRFDGIVRAKIFPQTPHPVFPTNLKVAKKWFALPRGCGLGRHARDALSHLVGVLVKESFR